MDIRASGDKQAYYRIYTGYNVATINKLPASLNNNTARMNDRIKHKQVTGQMNHQTADPRAKASVFLFFRTAHLVLPNTQADPSQNQKSHFHQRFTKQYALTINE